MLDTHGIELDCLVSTRLGLPAWAERRLRLRTCSISRIDYQERQWLASGWVVGPAGDVSHLDAPALDELPPSRRIGLRNSPRTLHGRSPFWVFFAG